ncbi:mannitol dehydrogenase family protein [Plantibacter cousiniae (nom. nud.)]|uniref:mannitol dehydrogenase family protein n=1 Tax=Plantibacter cousiniae (nom. nud.) TaxID=199709 RepID=UPI001D9E9440|nr:mannitol dehydrogenase family protein [Plantibacter cousiniae]CAH0214246.1 Mannitol 2-dehydrogenase [Plantibacter cousiniae]
MSTVTDVAGVAAGPGEEAVPRLSRARLPEFPSAPVRIVHLGLGAFHRAHQAWYTQLADPDHEWGIAAFTGRSPQAAVDLDAQDCLYTVVERSADGDSATIVGSIVEARDGADVARLHDLLAAETTAIVTLTVTESGYRLDAEGRPDASDPAVEHDVALLSDALDGGADLRDARPTTTLGRLLLGLEARRRAGAGSIAIVPCDNIADGGALVRRAMLALADRVRPETARWIADEVSFVSSSVDRITPRPTPADEATAAELTGFTDAAPVVTEPFTDWVLSGDFPAGRPAWESAGARFVDDLEPYEQRKLRLLNGAHSLLAYAGPLRGHATVAEAVGDEQCRAWVEEYWDETERHLPDDLGLTAYRTALLGRFDNARIEHRLQQIALEGVTKLRVRIVSTLLAERAAGRPGTGSLRVIAAWVAAVQGDDRPGDASGAAVAEALRFQGRERTAALVRLIDPRLLDSEPDDGSTLVTELEHLVDELTGRPRNP